MQRFWGAVLASLLLPQARADTVQEVLDLLGGLHDENVETLRSKEKTWATRKIECETQVQQKEDEIVTHRSSLTTAEEGFRSAVQRLEMLDQEKLQLERKMSETKDEMHKSYTFHSKKLEDLDGKIADYSKTIEALDRAIATISSVPGSVAANEPGEEDNTDNLLQLAVSNEPNAFDTKTIPLQKLLEDLKVKFTEEHVEAVASRAEFEASDEKARDALEAELSSLESERNTKVDVYTTIDESKSEHERQKGEADLAIANTKNEIDHQTSTCEQEAHTFMISQKDFAEDQKAIAQAIDILKKMVVPASALFLQRASLAAMRGTVPQHVNSEQQITNLLGQLKLLNETDFNFTEARNLSNTELEDLVGKIDDMIANVEATSIDAGHEAWCAEELDNSLAELAALRADEDAEDTMGSAFTQEIQNSRERIDTHNTEVEAAIEEIRKLKQDKAEDDTEREKLIEEYKAAQKALRRAIEVLRSLVRQSPTAATQKLETIFEDYIRLEGVEVQAGKDSESDVTQSIHDKETNKQASIINKKEELRKLDENESKQSASKGKLETIRKSILVVEEARDKLAPSCNATTRYGDFNASREEELQSLKLAKDILTDMIG